MKILSTILTVLSSIYSFSQIWDYPPEPTKPYEPNTNIKRTNVKLIKTYNYTLQNGERRNENPIYCEQQLDYLGNTIYYTVDTTKVLVKNDSVLKLYSNIVYDSLSRPIKQIIGKQVKTWKYKGDKLVEYTISITDELVESRFYDYQDSVLKYSICYPDIPSKSCDTVIATLNQNHQPTYVKAVNYFNEMPLITEMHINYDENGNNLGGKYSCERIEIQYSKENYRTRLKRYNCEGELIVDIEYEYEFY